MLRKAVTHWQSLTVSHSLSVSHSVTVSQSVGQLTDQTYLSPRTEPNRTPASNSSRLSDCSQGRRLRHFFGFLVFYFRLYFQKCLQRLRGHNSDVCGYRQCGQHNSSCCLSKIALWPSRTRHTTVTISCCTYFQFQPAGLSPSLCPKPAVSYSTRAPVHI